MVQDPIQITVSTLIAGGRPPFYGEVAIVGTGAGGSQADDVPVMCYNNVEAETYFGSSTNIAKAAAIVFSQGLRHARCVRAASTSDEDIRAAAETLSDLDVDFIVLANVLCTSSGNVAQHNALVNHCNDYSWLHLAGFSGTVASVQTNAAYLAQSKNVVALAACSNDDIAAALTGQLALRKPWEKMMWIEPLGVDILAYHSRSEVSQLEAGDPPVNVMIYKKQTGVISDGYTSVGSANNPSLTAYNWVDVTRTEYWLTTLINSKLEDLLMASQVPYTDVGIAQVEGKISEACEDVRMAGGITEYAVDIPPMSEISTTDKAERVLRNVIVTAMLAGHIQQIEISLTIYV